MIGNGIEELENLKAEDRAELKNMLEQSMKDPDSRKELTKGIEKAFKKFCLNRETTKIVIVNKGSYYQNRFGDKERIEDVERVKLFFPQYSMLETFAPKYLPVAQTLIEKIIKRSLEGNALLFYYPSSEFYGFYSIKNGEKPKQIEMIDFLDIELITELL